MAATELDIVIERGRTFEQVVRWESEPFLFAQISNVTNTAPIQITTTAPHNIPDGWRVVVVGAKGVTLLNAANNPPKTKDFRRVRAISASVVEFNSFSGASSSAYSGGGYLQWYTPVDLSGYTARMTVKDVVGGTTLLSFTVANSRLVLNNTLKTITMSMTATDTEVVSWISGVYDLELVSGTGVVTAVLTGKVRVTQEVTT